MLPLMLTTETFIDSVNAYLRATGMSPKAFGTAVVKDPNFVRELRAGRSVGLKLIEKVQQFMQDNPPLDEVG